MTGRAPTTQLDIKEPPPDVTILMPCLDEASTLPDCISMARDALAMLRDYGLAGEILISDNGSTDDSVEIALGLGCRVVHCPERGYGNALIHGAKAANGRFLVMGDADASYDFREAVPMVLKLAEGYDLCMGSRFKGRILPGAMPWKNRYIGNPVLTGMLNLFYRSGLSDAHCGLRAFTREAFGRMKLRCGGMEFASEMVVKATLLGLRCAEIPVTLHPDKRDGKPHLRPWRDGWRHWKYLLMLSPLWLFFVPSLLLILFSSTIFTLLLATPPDRVFHIGGLRMGDHWMILAGGLLAIGYQLAVSGMISHAYSVKAGLRQPTSAFRALHRLFEVEKAILASFLMISAAATLIFLVFQEWSGAHFGPLARIREMVIATSLIVIGIQHVFAAFLLSVLEGGAAEIEPIQDSPRECPPLLAFSRPRQGVRRSAVAGPSA